ncbi:hypothetical protein ACKFKG_03125 [Phormidesmis sp. 146-35]
MTNSQIKFMLGFIAGGLLATPAIVMRVNASFLDSLSRWSASYGNSAEAQEVEETPLPVPQNTPPVGRSNGSSIEPCAAPLPTMASVPTSEEMPTSLGNQPARRPAKPTYRDRRATILMNTAPGNRMRSLIGRVGYPDRFDDATSTDFYMTDDGEIAVVSDRATDTVASISLLSPNQ